MGKYTVTLEDGLRMQVRASSHYQACCLALDSAEKGARVASAILIGPWPPEDEPQQIPPVGEFDPDNQGLDPDDIEDAIDHIMGS